MLRLFLMLLVRRRRDFKFVRVLPVLEWGVICLYLTLFIAGLRILVDILLLAIVPLFKFLLGYTYIGLHLSNVRQTDCVTDVNSHEFC